MDKGIAFGSFLAVLGLVLFIVSLTIWGYGGFGELLPNYIMRITIPSVTLIEVGILIIFASFFIGILNIKTKSE